MFLSELPVEQTRYHNFCLTQDLPSVSDGQVLNNHIDTVCMKAKKDQKIFFDEIDEKNVGDAPFDLIAINDSKLPIDFKILSGPAIIHGNRVSLTKLVGKVVIEASQLGDDWYNPAEVVQRSFTVSKSVEAGSKSEHQQFQLKVGGHSFNSVLKVDYILHESAYTKLCLLNIVGAVVAIIVEGDQVPGVYSYNFNDYVAQGDYILYLISGNNVASVKVLKL